MNKILWKINRIRAMKFNEIIYRVKQGLVRKGNKIKYGKVVKITECEKFELNLNKVDSKLKVIWGNPKNIISNIKEEELFISNYGIQFDLTSDLEWNRGTKGHWEYEIYSLDICTRNTDDIGDIRCSWEINRMQFMPYLALIYKKTNDKKYLDLIKKHFNDWNDKNYFLKGINWVSPMEIAIRSYQWLVTYYLIDDDDLRKDMLIAIINSMKYVSNNLSKFSSANNHLILEAFILSEIGYIIEDVYPQNWCEIGYNILEKEMYLQNYDDGINKEHALHYQAFVTDAILQYNFFLRKINKKPIAEEIVKKSLSFMSDLNVDRLNFEFGDSDDAKILSFSLKNSNYYYYILQLGSIYYKTEFIAFEILLPEVKFISKVYERIKLEDYKSEKYKLYKDGGYCTVNSNNNTLLFDFAELGFGEIAAHGHADALSLIYYYKDEPIFIDAGTYIYNIEKEQRDYFRSTEAHNTLVYNDTNQSEIKGPFLWGKKAKPFLHSFEGNQEKVRVEASHDGYNPLVHKRIVEYNFIDESLEIIDYFDEVAKINFVLSPKSEIVKVNKNELIINNRGKKMMVQSNCEMCLKQTTISNSFSTKIRTNSICITNDFRDNNYTRILIKKCEELL